MNDLSSLKRVAIYSLLVLPMACLQQEIQPQPDKDTRGCLIKSSTGYFLNGTEWTTGSWEFTYNLDGNPATWKFFDNALTTYKTYTMEYDGLRLKRMSHFEGSTLAPDALTEYKTYAINEDITVLIEHSFRRNPDGKFSEVLTRQCSFFRNAGGDLRLQRVDIVTPDATPDGKNTLTGTYKRLEYDSEGRNVFRIWSKDNTMDKESVFLTFGGFDRNGRIPWNANFWLSFIQLDGDSFFNSIGFWSENNLSLASAGTEKPFYYYVYELNEAGFPCISSARRADNVPNQEETFYYYYNCDCRRR